MGKYGYFFSLKFIMKELILIDIKEFDVELDLRYASKNNVCKVAMYNSSKCYLHHQAIPPLRKAIESARQLNLKLKIFDGFRPISIQKFMYNKLSEAGGDGFISNPEGGAVPHCRGVALDLTLIDFSGKELDMGTDFDEFSHLAFHNCYEVSKEAQRNRLILLGIMTAAGWDFYSKEWWHYQLYDPRQYPIIDFDI